MTASPTPAGALPARVTTPLLTLITQQSMDEDYQHVAEQRRSGARPDSERAGRGLRILVVVLLFGGLLAVAGAQTARNASVTSAGRHELLTRIDSRRDALAAIKERTAQLRSDNSAGESRYDAAGRRLDSLGASRSTLLAATGFGAVAGAGVRVVVDNAPGGDRDGIVRDEDLALLVNGLWRAGATAISVNGQRLTALSALRNSAQAIGLNDVSLSPPYTLLAIGDKRTLQADFAESTSGARFQALSDQVGFRFSMDDRDNVRVPEARAGMMALHVARSGTSKQQKPPVNQEDTQ